MFQSLKHMRVVYFINKLYFSLCFTYVTLHATSQNHMIEGSNKFMSGSSSWYVTTLPSLIAIGIVLVEI